MFSVYQPATKSPIPLKDMPPIPVDPATRRTYSSALELQHINDKVDEIASALYRKILEEISVLGGRAVKIIFKPSCESTARLMENGDFRIKFEDGSHFLISISPKFFNFSFLFGILFEKFENIFIFLVLINSGK
ncbi:unnamed protein product [Gongylonema pulchrum]|uniref:Polo_box_3 domain-containing protein n=1 Tax=Gongylonema pulchrum TaxID=637853 RepID=A0A183DMA2_9BILA|nr:unnamed protein product [Gongylonema pulchrum]